MPQINHQPGSPNFAAAAAQTVLPAASFDAAVDEIQSWTGYTPTPLISLASIAEDLSLAEVWYKHEGPRFGLGSFKALGGAYAGMRVVQRELCRRLGRDDIALADIRAGLAYADAVKEVVLTSATDGNHGRSLAWGAQQIGAPCRIYIHAEVSEGRAQAMREYGAEVIRIDGDYDASVALCRQEAEQNGWFVVSDTSWPGYSEPPRDVMSGYGVMAREIVDALEAPATHVFLQGGVGGLAASVAAALRQSWGDQASRVCVVEPDLAPCLFESARAGEATAVELGDETIMAGLSCGVPSAMAWEILRHEASDFLTIGDDLVAPTVRRLARPSGDEPIIEAGESGVAGLAALIAACQSTSMRETLGLDSNSRVLLIGSEGVTDQAIFEQIMSTA